MRNPLSGGGVEALSEAKWQAFFVGDIFPNISRPKARSEKQYALGDIPFVASGNFNNGVIKCCTPHGTETPDAGNCITVSPVDGSAFYHVYDFLGRGGAGSSVIMLRRDRLTIGTGLFLANALRHTCSKYCYGKMGNQNSIKREKIMLPATPDGKPDLAYMDAYGREVMRQRLSRYLAYRA